MDYIFLNYLQLDSVCGFKLLMPVTATVNETKLALKAEAAASYICWGLVQLTPSSPFQQGKVSLFLHLSSPARDNY